MIQKGIQKRRQIYHLLYPYRWGVVGFCLLSVVAVAIEGTAVALLAPMLGLLLSEESLSSSESSLLNAVTRTLTSLGLVSVWHIGVLLVLLVLVKNILAFIVHYTGEVLRYHLLRGLQITLTERYTEIDYSYISRQNLGVLADLFVRCTFRGSAVFLAGLMTLHGLITVAIYSALLVGLSWHLALGVVFAGVFIALVNDWAVRVARRSGVQAAQEEVIVSGFVHGLLAGARVIRSFGREQHERERLDGWQDSIYARRKRKTVARHLPAPISETILILAIVGMLVVTVEVLGGTSVASLAVFAVILIRMMPQVAGLNRRRAHIASEFIYVEQVLQLLEETESAMKPDGQQLFRGLKRGIRFNHASFKYDGRGEYALEGIDVEMSRGKVTAFVGPSGGGKSTLLDLVLRLYDPSSGTVEIDGVDLRELDVRSWRARIGMVSQDGFLFNDTVRANIAYGKEDATAEEIEEAARQASAYDFIKELPQGFDTVVGERAVFLSGGQRQRLVIARTIIRDPDILIFDEATSELDTASERLIHEATIKALSRNRTVIVVAHRLSVVRDADQIIVLDRGRIVEQGTHQSLLAKGGLYYTLCTQDRLGQQVGSAGPVAVFPGREERKP